jgi:hypothetical protein
MRDVDPKRPRITSHSQSEPDADIDLGPACGNWREPAACSRDIGKQREARAAGRSRESFRLQFHTTVCQGPPEYAAIDVDDAVGQQRMCP